MATKLLPENTHQKNVTCHGPLEFILLETSIGKADIFTKNERLSIWFNAPNCHSVILYAELQRGIFTIGKRRVVLQGMGRLRRTNLMF